MDTRQLEYILAIAEEKNLSRAADRLFLSQSALSQHLAKLEAEGLPPLFVRKKGEMVLTDAGKIYINGARTILKINHDAEEALHDLRTSKVHHLHIGVCRLFHPLYYSRILPWLKHTYPDMEITAITPEIGQIRHALEYNELDLVLYASEQNFSDLVRYIPLREDELVLASLHSLQDIPLPLALPAKKTHLRLLADRAMRASGLYRPIYAEPEDIRLAITLASAGECAALVPKSCLEESGLNITSLQPDFHYFNVIATRRGTPTPVVAEICQWLKQLIGQSNPLPGKGI